jgi:hypothetical protein
VRRARGPAALGNRHFQRMVGVERDPYEGLGDMLRMAARIGE